MKSETTKSKRNALIISEAQDLIGSLRTQLEAQGWETVATNSVMPAKKLLKRGNIDLLVLDGEHLADASLHLSSPLKSVSDKTTLLVLSAQNGEKADLRGLEPSAILDHPFDASQLAETLRRFETNRFHDRESRILGRSEAIRQIWETIGQIAPTPVSVLVTGESGTGKDLIAQVIHESSPRRDARFLTINCGAIPETLLESELFGHEKGAFTDARTDRQGIFEAANGGTVFLDEIGEMSPSAQVRLLRVLEAREITRLGSTQARKVDVRLIASTNRDLQQAVVDGGFRRDLYYRLKVVEIPIPPLRRRPEDVPILIEHFVELYHKEHGVAPIELDSESLETLQGYNWPGNVRELKNLVERLMILSVKRQIGRDDVVGHLEDLDGNVSLGEAVPNLPIHLSKTPEESQRDLLYWAILEVARDVKELKAFLKGARTEVQSLPVYASDAPSFPERGTEVEYKEADSSVSMHKQVIPLREVERETIALALRTTGGHRKKAAKLLDMPERTLYRKIQQYDL